MCHHDEQTTTTTYQKSVHVTVCLLCPKDDLFTEGYERMIYTDIQY